MYEKKTLQNIVLNSVRIYKRDLQSALTPNDDEYYYDADLLRENEREKRRYRRHLQICENILLSKELIILFPGEEGIFRPTLDKFFSNSLWTYEHCVRRFIDSFPNDEDPEVKYEFIEKNFATRDENQAIEMVYFLLTCRYNFKF